VVGLAPATATAQVSVEIPVRKIFEQGRLLNVDVNFIGRAGNRTGVQTGGALFGALCTQDKRQLGLLKAQGDYANFGGAVSIAKSFVHARHQYELRERLFTDSYLQVQQDRFQRLLFRAVLGVGPRFALLFTDDVQLFAGTGYLLEYEEVSDVAGATDGVATLVHRSSNYVSLGLTVGTQATLSATVIAQPRWDDPADVRVLVDSGVNVMITKRLSLRASVLSRFDSQPPTDVRTYDLEVRNSQSLTL
jgi:putative salt-induced outer membrane protein YdiY